VLITRTLYALTLYRPSNRRISSTTHLRVYTQDVFGLVRKSVYEGGWSNGTSRGAIATAKPGSPTAAASEELQRVRVYCLSGLNTIMEAAYDSGSRWTDGSINSYFFQVAPYSKMAVCFLPGTGTLSVRLYAQMIDNTNQEFGLDGMVFRLACHTANTM
jgi:hypothetical protein